MKRRRFLSMTGAASAGLWLPGAFAAITQPRRQVLILIELKGGNDGLNTVIPFDDPLYRALRPRIAVARDATIQLDSRTGLHPSMKALLPLWHRHELAIVQGVGYESPNRSHFRSIEIWDTASHANEYVRDGWLARASRASFEPMRNVMIGSVEPGPFKDPLTCSAQCVAPDYSAGFPGPFGASVRAAIRHLATETPSLGGVSTVRLTLGGFDTHQHQTTQHAALLAQLSSGMVALRAALVRLGRWDDALIMTYSEFGRHPRENSQLGTDHGSTAPHFIAGGRVRGGLYGVAPDLARLDGNGNLPFSVDFRALYATVLQAGLGLDAAPILGERIEPLPFLRA